MATEIKKFLDKQGVSVLWDRVVAKVNESVKVEADRAKLAEEANAAAAKKAQDEVDALELVVAAKADQTALNALADKVGTLPEGSSVMEIIQNIQENAYDDTELRAEITSELAKKADKTQVADDIAAAVKAEEDARKEAVQNAVNTLSGTHATDKTALEAAIALKADQTALEAVSAVANAAATKVELKAEEDRAKGVEAGLEARIETMEVFWDTTEDADGVVNKLKEIQDYIASDESGAAAMAGNIQANTKAISDMDAAYKLADETLQGNIDKLAGTVDTKAAQADLEALDGRVEVLEGEMDAVEADIEALKGLFGEGETTPVADQIAAAVDVEKAAREAAVTKAIEDAAADATAKANKALEDAKADATAKADKALEDAKADATAKDVVVLTQSQQYTDDKFAEIQVLTAEDIDAAIEEATNNATA